MLLTFLKLVWVWSAIIPFMYYRHTHKLPAHSLSRKKKAAGVQANNLSMNQVFDHDDRDERVGLRDIVER